MSPPARVVVLSLLVALLAGPALAERTLVDGVAAVVGRRVITRTDVETEGRVVLVNRGGMKGLEQPIDDAYKKSVLEYMVVQELLVQEARRVHGVVIPESEVDKAVAVFRARFPNSEAFRAFLTSVASDEEAVRTIVRRDLTVQALLSRVLVVGTPTGDDVRRWLEKNPGFLDGAAEDTRLRAAEDALVRAAREERFERYVEELKGRTEVRVLASFAQPSVPPPSAP
jgi:hypothetical protein